MTATPKAMTVMKDMLSPPTKVSPMAWRVMPDAISGGIDVGPDACAEIEDASSSGIDVVFVGLILLFDQTKEGAAGLGDWCCGGGEVGTVASAVEDILVGSFMICFIRG
mmetsp:Transcript_13120/g.24139  ORF Transcript_13120/g.24139 Transcript_13120/m.24139 type:complete len:109 (-) Transcript_13120:40-366(-)